MMAILTVYVSRIIVHINFANITMVKRVGLVYDDIRTSAVGVSFPFFHSVFNNTLHITNTHQMVIDAEIDVGMTVIDRTTDIEETTVDTIMEGISIAGMTGITAEMTGTTADMTGAITVIMDRTDIILITGRLVLEKR